MLLLNPNGTVRSHQKISSTHGSFAGPLDNEDRFGNSLVRLGDLNADGVTELMVGAEWDSDAGIHHGAVWVLFLDTDGTVRSYQKINEILGGFSGDLDEDDHLALPRHDVDLAEPGAEATIQDGHPGSHDGVRGRLFPVARQLLA